MSDQDSKPIVIYQPKAISPTQQRISLLTPQNAAAVISGAAALLWLGKKAAELYLAQRQQNTALPHIPQLTRPAIRRNRKPEATPAPTEEPPAQKSITETQKPGVILRYTRYESWSIHIQPGPDEAK